MAISPHKTYPSHSNLSTQPISPRPFPATPFCEREFPLKRFIQAAEIHFYETLSPRVPGWEESKSGNCPLFPGKNSRILSRFYCIALPCSSSCISAVYVSSSVVNPRQFFQPNVQCSISMVNGYEISLKFAPESNEQKSIKYWPLSCRKTLYSINKLI